MLKEVEHYEVSQITWDSTSTLLRSRASYLSVNRQVLVKEGRWSKAIHPCKYHEDAAFRMIRQEWH